MQRSPVRSWNAEGAAWSGIATLGHWAISPGSSFPRGMSWRTCQRYPTPPVIVVGAARDGVADSPKAAPLSLRSATIHYASADLRH